MAKVGREVKYEDLDLSQKQLLDSATRVMETAYNPYSNFYVGAALLTTDGEIYSSSNVENAAYGSTICAERGAIMKANSAGKRTFTKIAINARGENFETKEVISPCGSCRQMLNEIAQISESDLEIIMSTTKQNKIVISTISELLPMAFGPRDLGIDIKRYQ